MQLEQGLIIPIEALGRPTYVVIEAASLTNCEFD